jgi:hypothetical protein
MKTLFKDAVLEQLSNSDDGWLLLATDGYINHYDDIMASVDIDKVNDLCYRDLQLRGSADFLSHVINNGLTIDGTENLLLLSTVIPMYFDIEFEENEPASETNVPTLVQKVTSLQKEEIENLIAKSLYDCIFYDIRNISRKKAAENLLNCIHPEHYKFKKLKSLDIKTEMNSFVRQIFQSNTYNIRSLKVFEKLTQYIKMACDPIMPDSKKDILYSKLLALRLRASTNEPIYSLENF